MKAGMYARIVMARTVEDVLRTYTPKELYDHGLLMTFPRKGTADTDTITDAEKVLMWSEMRNRAETELDSMFEAHFTKEHGHACA